MNLRASIVPLAMSCALALTAVPNPALAQEASDTEAAEATRAEARTLFEAGTDALRDERFEEAVQLLSRSHALLPNVANAFNLAVALQRRSRALESLALLAEIEREAFGALGPDQRRAVADRIVEVRAMVSTLQISIEPTETAVVVAELSIDDEAIGEVSVDEAASVTSSTEVDPGEHRIAVRARGFVSEARTVEVLPGATRALSFSLRPDVGLGTSEPVTAPVVTPAPSHGVEAWVWVVVTTVGLAAIAGAIALGVVLSSGPSGPVVDPVTGLGETLTESPLRLAF